MYRPISLLPVISKLLEKIVHEQITEYFDECARAGKPIIPHEQFAYRAQHSCEEALALAIIRWQNIIDEGNICGVVFCDMSKAFDPC